jgi:hypothetical protein
MEKYTKRCFLTLIRTSEQGRCPSTWPNWAKLPPRSYPCPPHSPSCEDSGEGAWSGGGWPIGVGNPLLVPLRHPFNRWWHGDMLRQCSLGLCASNSHSTALAPYMNRGVPPLQHTTIWASPHTPHSLVVVVLLFSWLEKGKATLESLAPWKKRPLGMNRNMSSSKVMLSYYNYRHTYCNRTDQIIRAQVQKQAPKRSNFRTWAHIISAVNRNHEGF